MNSKRTTPRPITCRRSSWDRSRCFPHTGPDELRKIISAWFSFLFFVFVCFALPYFSRSDWNAEVDWTWSEKSAACAPQPITRWWRHRDARWCILKIGMAWAGYEFYESTECWLSESIVAWPMAVTSTRDAGGWWRCWRRWWRRQGKQLLQLANDFTGWLISCLPCSN